MTPPLMAELATRWIRSGEAARMVEYKRAEARARWQLVRDALADVPTPSAPGSCFAWLYLPDPWRGADFVARAQRAGVAVTGAEAFVAGRATAPHAVRLSHSTPAEREEVERGLAILADVLRAGPGAARALV
jgi:DNA-binding transcriptional MocR family regulator